MDIFERMRKLGYDMTEVPNDKAWEGLRRDRLFVSHGNGTRLVFDRTAAETGFILHLCAPAECAGGRPLDIAFFPDGRLARALHGDEIIEDAEAAVARWVSARSHTVETAA